MFFLCLSPAAASTGLQAQVPNSGAFDCNLCHVAGPGSALNAFGSRVGATRAAPTTVKWSAVFDFDEDADGYTNGAELGDADGDGVAAPSFPATHPADPAAFPCGSHTLEGPELCDGSIVGGETCVSLGFVAGQLRCARDCRGFDTSACSSCGDGTIDPDEFCDDGLANSNTQPGACRPDCALPHCGDGVVDPGESCEPTLSAQCTDECAPLTCGNGALDPGEECDQGSGNSDTLADACRTRCVTAGCGDGVLDTGEECERGVNEPPVEGASCTPTCVWSRCPDGEYNLAGFCGDGPDRLGDASDDPDIAALHGGSFGCRALPGATGGWLLALLVLRGRRRHPSAV